MSMESAMVEDSEVGQTADNQPNPTRLGMSIIGTQQARSQHNPVSRDGRDEMGTRQAANKGEIGQDERGREGPIDIAKP